MTIHSKNVLGNLVHIFDQSGCKVVEDRDDLTELSDLKRLCKGLLVEKRQSMLERQRINVRVCVFAKLQFPKSQLNGCALHTPVRYERYCVAASNGNVVCKLPFMHFNSIHTVWI